MTTNIMSTNVMTTNINVHNKVGLIPYSNTCFMNAGIQLLMSVSVFMVFLLNIDNECTELNIDNDNSCYAKTAMDYYNTNTVTLGPLTIQSRFINLCKRYMGGTQEDTHEFLMYIIADIVENIQKLKNESYEKKIKKLISTTLKCHIHWRDNRSVDSDNAYDENILSFPIDDTCSTLECCKNLFLFSDNEDAKITYTLCNLPKYIIIHLKRWSYNHNHHIKNCTQIDIPFRTNIFDGVQNYKLKAFVVHSGSIIGGHYITYSVKKIDNEYKWFCFNDQSIREVSNEEELAKNAYVLLYSRE